MKDTLMVIGEALIDFTPTKQGVLLKDVCAFTKHCGGAPVSYTHLDVYKRQAQCCLL